ncbi:tRNA (adenosine(37)-N6)-threonylcarbamoyltransferase complex dimerization subunit type 1 TsaB [Rhodococcus sp. HNM0569]|uniref:tRNA (adenosine(37)-N6)-threonylcarbamoyltransferase complex dimerization subunit type 1 TsaB n=1 Tax=Rhodococcus sp. HNM0569 TaxID=2716340 RepID=UPI00146C872B|nr:tRNA (adenosine(37)-N6)-threonylcarbamoyltransferase complex dimerization subunit type 1 TsaB [Rhodococcus sp. HNM0569]
MLVLALDTATPAVTAGVVQLSPDGVRTEAVRVTVNARAHAEVLTPHILECLAESGHTPADLDAVVVGTGPGPFTGLRVGMATGAAFADALSIPAYGVCSLDAIAARESGAGELLVVTDARRREVYWARYREGRRVEGPSVDRPADVVAAPSTAVAGSRAHAEPFALPVLPADVPTPESLVTVAAADILAGREPEPLEPLYLRRPDAATLAEREAAKLAAARTS